MTEIIKARGGESNALFDQRAATRQNPAIMKLMQSRGNSDNVIQLLKNIESTREASKKENISGANIVVKILSKNETTFSGKKSLRYSCMISKLKYCEPVEKDENGVDAVPVPVKVMCVSDDEDINVLMHFLSYHKKEEKDKPLPDFLEKFNIDLQKVFQFKMSKETMTKIASEFVAVGGARSPLMEQSNRKELASRCEKYLREAIAKKPGLGYAVTTFVERFEQLPKKGYVYPRAFRDIKAEEKHIFPEGAMVQMMDCYLFTTLKYNPFDKNGQIAKEPFNVSYTLKLSDASVIVVVPKRLMKKAMGDNYEKYLLPPALQGLAQSHESMSLSNPLVAIRVRPYDYAELLGMMQNGPDNMISFRYDGFADGTAGFYATPKSELTKPENQRVHRICAKKGLWGFQWKVPLAKTEGEDYWVSEAVDHIEKYAEKFDIDCAVWSDHLAVFGVNNVENWKRVAPLILKNFDGILLVEEDGMSHKKYKDAKVIQDRQQKTLMASVGDRYTVKKNDTREEANEKRLSKLENLFIQKEFVDATFSYSVKAMFTDAKQVISNAGIRIDAKGVSTIYVKDAKAAKTFKFSGAPKDTEVFLLDESDLKLAKLTDNDYEFYAVGDFNVISNKHLLEKIPKELASLYFERDYNSGDDNALKDFYKKHSIPEDSLFRQVKIAKGSFVHVFAVKKEEDEEEFNNVFATFKKYFGDDDDDEKEPVGSNTNVPPRALETEQSNLKVEEVADDIEPYYDEEGTAWVAAPEEDNEAFSTEINENDDVVMPEVEESQIESSQTETHRKGSSDRKRKNRTETGDENVDVEERPTKKPKNKKTT